MKKNVNILLLIAFLIILVGILFIGNIYKSQKIDERIYSKYDAIALSITDEIKTLIKYKQNATLAIALSLSQNNKFEDELLMKTTNSLILENFLRTLKNETNFKNVWIQIVDKNGISRLRSWTSAKGDDVSITRKEVRSMISNPRIISIISVGEYDMTFKAMVPLYDKKSKFIGFLEVITHFNYIAQKLKEKGFDPVIFVDAKYKKQLTYPYTKIFVNDNYIANKSANENILKYIEKQGLKYFISPNKRYIIDKKKHNIVIGYTLFDSSHQVMASFLMFKPLNDINFKPIYSTNHDINLIMLISIFILGLGFYLLNKEKYSFSASLGIKKSILVFIFIFLSFLYYLLLNFNYQLEEEDFVSNYNKKIKIDYNIIHEKFTTIANTIFQTVINKPNVLELMSKAYNKKTKDIARKELYKLLLNDYEFFKTYNLRQFHFYLKNNESFLRFHKPSKYGDILTGIRSTVEWTNKNFEKIDGFEEGKIFNGFRYVFPLFKKNKNKEKIYIGSAGASFSAFAMATEFSNWYKLKVGFIISKDIVNKKVSNDEKLNYSISVFKNFSYENSIKKQLQNALIYIDISNLTKKQILSSSKKIYEGKVFSIFSKNNNKIFTFIPIKNPVTKEVVAAMILEKETTELINEKNKYLLLLFSGIVGILFIILYIYKEINSKYKLKQLSKKTQKILDLQDTIIVVTDGKNIVDVNKKFLDFFKFNTLNDFKKVHNCINDYFEKDDRFFHLGKVKNKKEWIKELLLLPNKNNIVLIKKYAFSISISTFNTKYILTFSNITDTIFEQFSLKEKATHDKLTGAYNREYFHENISLLIRQSYARDLHLGVIMFDIDNFKLVNDLYGHNVGDSVLKHLVELIYKTIRTDDKLIRWGGEEFFIIIKTSSLKNLFNISENIRKTIENQNFSEVKQITCSFGITLYKKGELSEETIKRVDTALYEAKESGRNKVISK